MNSELPSRSEFEAFWNRQSNPLHTLAGVVIYLAVLVLYALFAPRLIPTVDHGDLHILGFLFVALGLPALYAHLFWRHYDRFLRCPLCRDWVGTDVTGACNGPNPKWRIIATTLHCVLCGQQMVRADPTESSSTGQQIRVANGRPQKQDPCLPPRCLRETEQN
jgi:hypothetical protein